MADDDVTSIGPLIYPLEAGNEISYPISDYNNFFPSDPNCPLIIDLRSYDASSDSYLTYTETDIELD